MADLVLAPERTPVPPFDLVIVGARGDLALRKLLPALARRTAEGVIPTGSRIIGLVRSDTSDLSDLAGRRMAEEGITALEAAGLLQRLSFISADATDPQALAPLRARLDEHRRVRAFYLATAPDMFVPVTQALSDAQLLHGEYRVILEKPLGSDLASARKINAAIAKCVPEHQIYRIDHYLGKEAVQNLLVLRFANYLFERAWSQRDIDNVQISVAETLGLQQRASYFDKIGTLRDMVQNHVLQLLSLYAMEPPNALSADAVREEKVRVLRALRPLKGVDVLSRTVRGQYSRGSINGTPVAGYAEELGHASNTETFVAMRCDVDTWRWSGVPIYIRTGKRMGSRFSEIVVTFKSIPHVIFKSQDHGHVQGPNRLIIRLQPNDGLQLQFMMKMPGSGPLRVVPRTLDLRYATAFNERAPDAYERLLTDVIRGDQTLFMRRDEVEAAWRFVDPIMEGWQEFYSTPHAYVAGTEGPPEAIALIEREGRSWIQAGN
ncbi:MAG: glucose-6-phosphate dehydrogenase [Terriglobia bacterium]